MEKSFPLDELIDIDELQSIQDSFAKAAGISSVILSPEGEPLTKFTNPTGFCSLIQSTEKGKERCFQSFMEMGKIALLSNKPEICYCFAHGGHFVAPIMIDGKHKGTMFAGQFIPEKFSSEQLQNFEKIAPEIDLDQGTLVKEAGKMRVVGEDVIRNYSSLLFKVVEVIARRGAQAAELERHVQERTAELAEANKGLEQEVVERKLAEEAIRESEKKYRSLFEFGMDGILIADIETKRFKYANPALCKMLGYSAEELDGMSISDIHPKHKLEHIISDFKAQARGEKTLAQNIPCLRKDGTIIYADINTTAALVDEKKCNIGFFRDNSERKKVQEALRESEEKIRMITVSANDAIIMIDPEGNISYWNKAAERMFDYTEEEVIGKDLHALLVPERFHAGFSKGFEGFKETGQGDALGKTVELAGVGKDDKEFPVELSLSAVKLKGRWNAIGLIRDITKRKAAEEELKKKAEELEAFNKLAVGRELKMIELKKEINALLEKSGKEPGYKIVGEPQREVF